MAMTNALATNDRHDATEIPDCRSCTLGRAAGHPDQGRCPLVCRTRPAGAFVYVEGQRADQVYYIKRGVVVLSRDTGERRGPVAWTVRRPGALVGAESLVQHTYTDTARTATESAICTGPVMTFEHWMGAREGAARAVLDVTLRQTCEDAPRRAGSDGSAVQRVAAWLLEQRHDDPARRLPRHLVAELLGMLPETLSRALATLAKSGSIRVDRKNIDVVDADRLDALANGDKD